MADTSSPHAPRLVHAAPALRFNCGEAGGALGDLGTFVPLLVGMVNRCGLPLEPALFCAGAMNVVSGVVFGIPMAVQPMKAIATVAIAEGLSASQIIAAGLVTSGVVLILGVSGLICWLDRVIPRSVVRGLQLGLGLKLLTTGIGEILAVPLVGWDSALTAAVGVVVVLWMYFSDRVPGALVLFGVGVVALLAADPGLLADVHVGMKWPLPSLGSWSDWRIGVLRGAVPQIPLTVLNSVIAVCALSMDLFPARPAAPRRVATSVALMNLVCCPLGGMPMCHGAGGLAGQYRFGARTGGSVVLLGAAKMILAVLFGGSLLTWLEAYPGSVLGVLLIFSGLELSLVCRDQTAKIDFFVMILTASACLAASTAFGFVVGWTMAVLLLRGVFRIDQPHARK